MTLFDELATLVSRQKSFGMIGVKSEFESEGVRSNEFNIVNSLAKRLDMKSILKIGGAEAKSDMFIAADNLCDYIVAPMIESPYAAQKCIDAYNQLISKPLLSYPKLLINIETALAMQNLDKIVDTISGTAAGIVFGRVDFTLSSGLTRTDIPSEYVSSSVIQASQICRDKGLEFVVGGGISIESIDLLRQLIEIRLDRFETRKCVINASAVLDDSIHQLLKDCVKFELLWLKFKSTLYSSYSQEDLSRISMLEQRHLYNISSCNE